ncbi:MAG: dehydrogenase E1 component subunit alpha/beta [Planctomycetota bacterium]|nr:dehydrogenase E1 component subunit alpha/beta [Planctomycetota bacterium]
MTTTTKTQLDKQTLLSLYRTMQIIRQCEERLAKSHQRGLVHGACHTYVGQEAIATGVFAHLRNEDVVFSTHRGHGHALAKGMHPKELIAELYGRETGCSQGRGGSMHLFKPEIGMMGTSGIVGPCILHACGAGYAFKIKKSDNVAAACFGDGAVNNGAFHEGLNMASIWKLPVIFVVENNQFATEVPFSYSSGIPDVGRRAENYGMPGFELDGNDVLEIHRVASEAIERARVGGGPTLIECKTYRTRAHAEGMGDFSYRTKEDVEEWKTRCPIQRLRSCLVDEGAATADELDAIEQEIRDLIEQSHQFAEASAYPAGESATAHAYWEGEAKPIAAEPLPGTRETTFVAATHEALDHAMAENPHIFVMGEGIGVRGGNFMTTAGLYDKYGAERLCDTPICERGFVGLGCGAAATGARPVIDFMFIDFINDAFGEMINQIAKMQYMSSGRLKMPILLRGCGGIGHSAATHHSGMYHSIYAHIPGLRVVMPSTPYDAKGLIAHALRSNDPVLFLEHRELMSIKGPVPEENYEIPFGQAKVVREGTDATVVAISLMVQHAIKAAEQLAAEGISIEIVDPRTVSPLDTETILKSVAKTGRVLVVDEAFGPCSVASEIAAQIADAGFDDLDAPVKRLNGAFAPTPYSPTLEKAVVPHVEDVVRAIRLLLEE